MHLYINFLGSILMFLRPVTLDNAHFYEAQKSLVQQTIQNNVEGSTEQRHEWFTKQVSGRC